MATSLARFEVLSAACVYKALTLVLMTVMRISYWGMGQGIARWQRVAALFAVSSIFQLGEMD
jgi:hypothetical protein